ncbi:MAG TPA: hypothetical protein VFF67_06230 [Thermoplasmata archaeon]|nr:hypothetical protein [Thermoplasmata archaeon]
MAPLIKSTVIASTPRRPALARPPPDGFAGARNLTPGSKCPTASTIATTPPSRSRSRAVLPFLVAAALLVAFLALEPLLSFSVFGSDTGEYYRLTASLVNSGGIPRGSAYPGWGFSYPDFPGIFLLAASGVGALGIDPLAALEYIVPLVGVLSILPLFLLFRRMVGHDGVAVLGAALATIAMPRMFTIAHPAPLALGDFLVVAGLWMFVEGRRDLRWYFPLGLAGGALIVTHHLSSYFLLVSALGALVLFEMGRPAAWSRRFPLREFVFLAGFTAVLLAYWLAYTRSFGTLLTQGIPGVHSEGTVPVVLAGLLALVFLAAALLVRWRRRSARHPARWARFPTDRSIVRDAAILLGLTFGGIAVVLLVPLPGTTQTTSAAAVAFFAPLLATIAFSTGSRRLVTFERLGPLGIAWIGALGLSAVFAIGTANPVLIPSRHVEYLVIPAMFLVAIGLARLLARWSDRPGRSAWVAGGTAILVVVAANAAIVYPPPAEFGGFQEGLSMQDAGLWLWVGVGIPPTAVVASDHRLSSMVFGFDGNRATWDSTPALFVGSNASRASADLQGSFAPHPSAAGRLLPVWSVAVDATMYQGVALDPSAPALPLSHAAIGWFDRPPFVPLYENGPQAVYWLEGSTIPG